MTAIQLNLIDKVVDSEGKVEFKFDDNITIQFNSEDAVVVFCQEFTTPIDLMRQFAIAYSTDHGGLGQCAITYDLFDANGNIMKAAG
jgi:hypothetical protein